MKLIYTGSHALSDALKIGLKGEFFPNHFWCYEDEDGSGWVFALIHGELIVEHHASPITDWEAYGTRNNGPNLGSWKLDGFMLSYKHNLYTVAQVIEADPYRVITEAMLT